MSDVEKVVVGFASPPSFSVSDYVREVQAGPYVDCYDFRFNKLVDDLPVVLKKFTNDIVGKAILSHFYGEFMAKDFRAWVRNQMDPSIELEDGGAGCEDYDTFTVIDGFTCERRAHEDTSK